jgi:ATP-dependent helicase/nuclease subunit B
MSADNPHRTHRVFMGLHESALKPQNRKYTLEPYEIFLLSQKYGFFVENPEHRADVFELRWAADNGKTQDHFTYPLTNFSGSAEAPSSFWILLKSDNELPKEGHLVHEPEATRWDELQLNSEVKEEDFSEVKMSEPPRLSASSLTKLRKCGFIFLSEKGFFLNDPDIQDLDLSAMKSGSLLHALLEKAIQFINGDLPPDKDLQQLIEDTKVAQKISYLEGFLWEARKKSYLDLLKRFLAFEKDWQKKFPQRKVLACEKDIQFSFKGYNFSGKVDRIDTDMDNNLVILDYKSGDSQAENWGSWIKNNNIQLAFYMWVLEKNLVTDIPTKEVVGAFYFALRTMDRSQGLSLEHSLNESKGRYSIKPDEKIQLIKDFESLLMELLEKVKEGDFSPRPMDEVDCFDCRWRKLCRAPHLS